MKVGELKIKHNQTIKVRETHLKSKIFNRNCFNTIFKVYNFIVILFLRIFVDFKKKSTYKANLVLLVFMFD